MATISSPEARTVLKPNRAKVEMGSPLQNPGGLALEKVSWYWVIGIELCASRPRVNYGGSARISSIENGSVSSESNSEMLTTAQAELRRRC